MPKDFAVKLDRLKAEFEKTKQAQLEYLREKRNETLAALNDLDTQIAELTGTGPRKGKRPRAGKTEIQNLISGVTSKQPLTQKEISEKTGIAYGSVVQWLRKHETEFKITGKRKNRRFSWKGD